VPSSRRIDTVLVGPLECEGPGTLGGNNLGTVHVDSSDRPSATPPLGPRRWPPCRFRRVWLVSPCAPWWTSPRHGRHIQKKDARSLGLGHFSAGHSWSPRIDLSADAWPGGGTPVFSSHRCSGSRRADAWRRTARSWLNGFQAPCFITCQTATMSTRHRIDIQNHEPTKHETAIIVTPPMSGATSRCLRA